MARFRILVSATLAIAHLTCGEAPLNYGAPSARYVAPSNGYGISGGYSGSGAYSGTGRGGYSRGASGGYLGGNRGGYSGLVNGGYSEGSRGGYDGEAGVGGFSGGNRGEYSGDANGGYSGGRGGYSGGVNAGYVNEPLEVTLPVPTVCIPVEHVVDTSEELVATWALKC